MRRDFQISIRFRGLKKRRDFLLKLLSLIAFLNSTLSRQSGLSSFPQNSLSVSLACESLLSVFTRTQVVRTRATRRKQHTE
jgi:hypothetical protein